jgi:hypothetical protein
VSIKLCIFGGRTLFPSIDEINLELARMALHQGYCSLDGMYRHITEVVCGMANGADAQGRVWGLTHKIKITPFYAKWTEHGKLSGHIRNAAMADYCTHGLGFWDGTSGGTANMCAQLTLRRKPCWLAEMKAQ